MKVNPYLNFNGTCKQAFELYAQVLGGEIVMMQKHGESQVADHMPAELHDTILHARLVFGDNLLMGSDSPPQYYAKPQGLYVSLQLDGVEEAERIYAGLSEGAEISMPLQETFWAARFAMLTDRFGTPWMINCDLKA